MPWGVFVFQCFPTCADTTRHQFSVVTMGDNCFAWWLTFRGFDRNRVQDSCFPAAFHVFNAWGIDSPALRSTGTGLQAWRWPWSFPCSDDSTAFCRRRSWCAYRRRSPWARTIWRCVRCVVFQPQRGPLVEGLEGPARWHNYLRERAAWAASQLRSSERIPEDHLTDVDG